MKVIEIGYKNESKKTKLYRCETLNIIRLLGGIRNFLDGDNLSSVIDVKYLRDERC